MKLPISGMKIADFRADLTLFRNKYTPRPSAEAEGLSWNAFCETVAPISGPQVRSDKTRVTYYIASQLQDAPLVGKTLESAIANGQPTVGKQRSSGHVTTTTTLVLDCDGITDAELAQLREALTGFSYLMYSTYSHGDPDKPGNRVRVVLLLDRAVNRDEYALSHQVVCKVFGVPIDATGKHLEQQQGVWATHPEWKSATFRHLGTGSILSTAGLLKMAETLGIAKPRTRRPIAADFNNDLIALALPDLERLQAALPWLKAIGYSAWMTGITALKAIEPYYPDAVIKAMALQFAATSAPDSSALRIVQ